MCKLSQILKSIILAHITLLQSITGILFEDWHVETISVSFMIPEPDNTTPDDSPSLSDEQLSDAQSYLRKLFNNNGEQ